MGKKHKKTSKKSFTGTVRITARGSGFILPTEKAEWIRVDDDYLNTGLQGDTVEFVIKKRGKETYARVKKILSRHKRSFVGTIKKDPEGDFYITPQDGRVYTNIYISNATSASKHVGKKALVEMYDWEDPRVFPEGKIIEVIGAPLAHETEMRAAILDRGIEDVFDASVEKEAQQLQKQKESILADALAERLDYRSEITFTIDPEDAKDFDDALSYKELEDGNIEIGVHIADVTHYVQPDSLLDQEAIERGTSTYLVDRTIPMLPEVLSNDLCSLNPQEDKLAFSVLFTMDKASLGTNTPVNILSYRIEETVICSNKRFTYEEAQQILDAKNGLYYKELSDLNLLAKKLSKRNKKNGAISFSSEEVKFTLDKKGSPTGVYIKQTGETNEMIEQWMLLANKTVTEYVHKKVPESKRLFLYRIHDEPDKERVIELVHLLKTLGYKPQLKGGTLTSKEINSILAQSEGTPEENMIHIATIRSMAKAIYSIHNIGHFGLAFTHYTHFTSPIRRYPDMIVHRLIKRYQKEKPVSKKQISTYKNLALNLSNKEKNAMEAERASVKYKQVEYIQTKKDTVLEGTITGVTNWGIYVEEKTSKAEGLIRMQDLGNEYFTFHKERLCLVGKKSKKTYRLGDEVAMKIKEANLSTSTLEYRLA